MLHVLAGHRYTCYARTCEGNFTTMHALKGAGIWINYTVRIPGRGRAVRGERGGKGRPCGIDTQYACIHRSDRTLHVCLSSYF